MITIKITNSKIHRDINDWLSDAYDLATCGGQRSLQDDLYYILIRDWVTEKGTIADLVISGKHFSQAAGLGLVGSKCPCQWVKYVESQGYTTFVERFWRHIKGL